IDHAQVSDWRRQRDVRLRALADTPDAFGALLADEQKFRDEDWIARLAKTDRATFLAVLDGRDAGMIVIGPYDDDAGLYGMWVAPEARGKGVADALISTGIEWARTQGFQRIFLASAISTRPRSGSMSVTVFCQLA